MDNSIYKLEYNQIQEIIASLCKTYMGKGLAVALEPAFDYEQVDYLLNLSLAASNLIVKQGRPPLCELPNVSVFIKHLESGSSLSISGLLGVASILRNSRELKEYFFKEQVLFDNANSTSVNTFNEADNNVNSTNGITLHSPLLNDLFSSLYSNLNLEHTILEKIVDEDTLEDSASPKLNSLRKQKRHLEQEIRNKLNAFIHSSTNSKYIMEPIITIRNNRYVVPIKEEYRSSVKGFIHDTSSSGSTLYIEPMVIFEINNSIQSVVLEEELEVERILQELSNMLAPYVAELQKNLEIIGKLDLLFAKAIYGIKNNCCVPCLNKEHSVNLQKARHPFIDASVVVPVDISLGANYNCLVITGPNTGGKTVALKTVGLLLLMAYSGIPIPCKEQSSICVFDNIYADIGDEQSIEASLSTFSAHMTNIVGITKNATNNSLVLLDELGSGTDPLEGASLAISILEFLNNVGCLIIATTHYQELKKYALVTSGFENASFEFNLETLSPTYNLLIGVPGKSNAFAISQKLGLFDTLIERAKELLEKDDVDIEELLKNIYDNKLEIENEKNEIDKNLRQIELLRKSLEEKQSSLYEKRDKILDSAKAEAREILLSAKETASETIKTLNKTISDSKNMHQNGMYSNSDSNPLNTANRARDNLNIALKNVSNAGLYDHSNLEGNSYNNSNFENDFDNISVSNDLGGVINKPDNMLLHDKDVYSGLEVFVPSFNTVGTILSNHVSKSGEVQVQINSAKMNMHLANLRKVVSSETNSNNFNNTKNHFTKSSFNNTPSKSSITTAKGTSSYTTTYSKSQFVSAEINVIGETVLDATQLIDKYIDNCFLAKLSPIRIVHGKGTGKLRAGIHNYLKSNSHVKSFRLGTFGEGEMGVTIVELKL